MTDREADFEVWWQEHGQFCRSGGGDYEKTFAYRAWQAAIKQEREACAKACVDYALSFSYDEDTRHAIYDCSYAIRARCEDREGS